MGKRVAVIQSNYIPWKGYFDIIHDVDLFVFYDDVQYTQRDWRNRNIVKTPNGPSWLTIPVGHSHDKRICDVEIQDTEWARRHWRMLQHCYRRAPHFDDYAQLLEAVYLERVWDNLSKLNQFLIRTIATEWLGIRVEFDDSRTFALTGVKSDRMLDLLKKVGAGTYVSGPAAKDYISEERFQDAGIELVWKDYEGYPEYPQLHPPFSHRVTILDLLFHVGPEAPHFIWGWRSPSA
jgi:hypothetical protein